MLSGPVHLHQRPYQRQEDDHTFLARAVALNCRRMAKYIATWAIGIGIYIPNHRCYSHTDLFSTLKRNISALGPCRLVGPDEAVAVHLLGHQQTCSFKEEEQGTRQSAFAQWR
jgi:hypothetical protein